MNRKSYSIAIFFNTTMIKTNTKMLILSKFDSKDIYLDQGTVIGMYVVYLTALLTSFGKLITIWHFIFFFQKPYPIYFEYLPYITSLYIF